MVSLVERFISRYARLPTEKDPDYLEMLRMSKYRILSIPDVKPAKCANCGSAKQDGRKYIDFGLDIDWYGVVFLCTQCLKDIANKAELFKELEEQLAEKIEQLSGTTDLEKKGEELYERVVRTFKEFETFYVGIYPHSADFSNSVVDNPDGPSSVVVGTATVKSGTNKTESRTSESSSSSGRSNIQKFTELLERD